MRVLIIDDSAGDRRLCRILLEESYGPDLEFFEAATGDEGLVLCQTADPDCVLLDYKLMFVTGVEFLTKMAASIPTETRTFAVVMLTGLGSERVAVEAMKAGAQDYLVKDRITAESLQHAVDQATEKVALTRALHAERERLARSLAEKDVLLRELHHRVKNNLQVIVSLLRLQADSLTADSSVVDSTAGDSTPGDSAAGDSVSNAARYRAMEERAARILRDSRDRVESMALIHEQLYETQLPAIDSSISSAGSALPGSGADPVERMDARDLREVDLGQHAAVLVHNLMHSYGVDPQRIACRTNITPAPVAVDRAIPAGLILNELISNALRHAFPDNRRGSLAVTVRQESGTVTLLVQDDGVGVRTGIGPRRRKSLGLEIIQILIRQLKGSFEMMPAPAQAQDGDADTGGSEKLSTGTLCRVTFPASVREDTARPAPDAHARRAASEKNSAGEMRSAAHR